jgi:hypothetical protein
MDLTKTASGLAELIETVDKFTELDFGVIVELVAI